MTSILSKERDGHGFYYGFAPDDGRQVNVRYETFGLCEPMGYAAYVGGERLPYKYETLEDAEAGALKWMKLHPEESQ